MATCKILQALAWFLLVTVRSEVQDDFSPECREFLYMGTPPKGLENEILKKICQRYNGKPRYVTLYDVVDHIPVYSAYTFKRSDGSKKVDVPWMYEPQLSTDSGPGEMQPFPVDSLHKSFEDAQAVLEDYSNIVSFERGHLNPDEHQAHPDDKASTYTLTNVVPQEREFNIRVWKLHERTIRRRLNNYCRGTAYVVTGVTTSGRMIRRHNADRLAIPTYLWSAYCCVDYDHNAPFKERSKFPTHASRALNDKRNSDLLEISVRELEDFLKKNTFVDKKFQIFYEDCVPNNAIMTP